MSFRMYESSLGSGGHYVYGDAKGFGKLDLLVDH